jgi:hypothetical protein
MLYQDSLTGMLHEVPDSQVQGWGLAEDPYGVGEPQMVYDGLGNPLGWGFLKKLVKKAMPLATSMLGPYGQIIKHGLPVLRRALAPTAQALRQQALQQARGFGEVAPAAAAPVVAVPAAPVVPVAAGVPLRRPLPRGWMRPQGPGPQARRVYLRCSAWRGPRGLVPVNVAPDAPGVTTPAAVAVAAQAAPGPRRYRGRGRRR